MKASTGLAQKIIVLTCGSRGELQGPRLDTAVRNDMPNMVLRPSRTRFASGAGGFHLLVPQPPMTPGVEGRDAAIYKLNEQVNQVCRNDKRDAAISKRLCNQVCSPRSNHSHYLFPLAFCFRFALREEQTPIGIKRNTWSYNTPSVPGLERSPRR